MESRALKHADRAQREPPAIPVARPPLSQEFSALWAPEAPKPPFMSTGSTPVRAGPNRIDLKSLNKLSENFRMSLLSAREQRTRTCSSKTRAGRHARVHSRRRLIAAALSVSGRRDRVAGQMGSWEGSCSRAQVAARWSKKAHPRTSRPSSTAFSIPLYFKSEYKLWSSPAWVLKKILDFDYSNMNHILSAVLTYDIMPSSAILINPIWATTLFLYSFLFDTANSDLRYTVQYQINTIPIMFRVYCTLLLFVMECTVLVYSSGHALAE